MAPVAGGRADSSWCDVAVIGAGVAGLQAARSLVALAQEELFRGQLPRRCPGPCGSGAPAERPLRVVVVEASTRIGGRVRSLEGLPRAGPVELGAEFLHGRQRSSAATALLDELRVPHREVDYRLRTLSPPPDRYFLGAQGQLLAGAEAEQDADISAVHAFFQGLPGMCAEDAEDVSVRELMQRRGYTPRQLALADSIYANDFGCSLDELGLRESIVEAKSWVYGDSYIVLARHSLASTLVTHLAKGLEVWREWPVASVSYDGKQEDEERVLGLSPACAGIGGTQPLPWQPGPAGALCREQDAPCTRPERCSAGPCSCTAFRAHLQSTDGRLLSARCVIIAVPLMMLRSIAFQPPLPHAKREAIRRIKASNAVKVLLVFSERFWAQDLFDVVCTDSFLPEIWVAPRPPLDPPAAAGPALTAARVCCCGPTAQGATPAPLAGPRQELSRDSPGGCESTGPNDSEVPAVLRREGRVVVTGFAAGKRAQEMSRMPPQEVVLRSLAQLDGMMAACGARRVGQAAPPSPGARVQLASGQGPGQWVVREDGGGLPGCACPVHSPASAAFVGALVVDWAQEPWIRGAYSHPSLAALGLRDALAAPLGGCLFFAGEATHPGVNPCLQAAMDTGHRAAVQAQGVLQQHSRL